jgi:hypothetical protein
MNRYAELLAAIGLPDDYLVIDTETNGMDVRNNLTLPVQLGYALVLGRKVEDCGAIVVNWALVLPERFRADFWARCRRADQNMAARGIRCRVPVDRIVAEGADPMIAWPAYHDLVSDALGNGMKVAGHNIMAFDCPLLEKTALQMDTELTFDPERLLDFGLIEKAHSASLELPDDVKGTIAQWYSYVKGAFVKGKWSLDTCISKYGLEVDPSLAHDAVQDCLATHLLVEAHRACAEGTWPRCSVATSIPSRSPS